MRIWLWPQQVHDDAWMDTSCQQLHCRGVSAVVPADVPYAGVLEQSAPGGVVGVLVDRSAVGLREDEIRVLPFGACYVALALLRFAVLAQCIDWLSQRRDGPPHETAPVPGYGGNSEPER